MAPESISVTGGVLLAVSFSRKWRAKQGDVFDPIAERGDVDPDHGQAVVEVGAEPAVP